MIRYMLDTNTVSSLVNDPGGPVSAQIERLGYMAVAISAVIEAEIAYGLVWSGGRARGAIRRSRRSSRS